MMKSLKETKEKKYILIKNFILSSFIGGGVAFLFFLLYLLVTPSFSYTLVEMLGIISAISFISGIVSIGGFFINTFLAKLGVANNILRQVIVFFVTIILIGSMAIVYSIYKGFYNFEPLLLLIGISGFIIAAVAIIIENIIWKMRKKVLALEIKNKYLEEIAEKERLLEETGKDLIISQERNRIARELHDSVSQGLNGIKYIVHSMKKKVNNEDFSKIRSYLDELQEMTEESIKELRNMIFALKPPSLDKKGLSNALKTQCELFAKRNEIKVYDKIDPISGLNSEQELAIYRILQEALTNIQKHSGATEVHVSFEESERKAHLIIKDNGCGFSDDRTGGNGIRNMKTRTLNNNGIIVIESSEGNGTSIKAEFNIMNE